MFCKYCGKELKDDAEFCPYCGKKQNPDNTTLTRENAEQVSPAQTGENAEQVSPAQTEENAEQVSPEQTEEKEKQDSSVQTTDKSTKTNGKRQKTKGLNPGQKKFLSRNRAIIAIVVVIVIAVVSIVAVTRNSGETYETAVTKDGISYTAKTMWIVGEGQKNVGNTLFASTGKTSFSKQIDKIMDSYEKSRQTIDANGARANASYRMFELLCVIAEELDESGKYAYAAADSALKRYKEMDADIKYENLQEVNGLYRCAEMLAYILYELEGEGSASEIQTIMESITKSDTLDLTEPDTENFWECQGQAATAMYEYLYLIVGKLDLPYETWEDIENYYQNGGEVDLDLIERQKDYVQYNPGERQYVGGFYRIYEILKLVCSNWDITSEYTDDVLAIVDDYKAASDLRSEMNGTIELYTEEEVQRDLGYLTSVMQCCTSLLSILARSLA